MGRFLFIISFLLIFCSVSHAAGTEYAIIDFLEVPSGLKSTLKYYVYNNTKKSTRILIQESYGDGFSMNTNNCNTLGPKKSCSVLFNFDSKRKALGSWIGFARIQLSNNSFYEFTLRANVVRSLQTPMGDKEAEDYFSARIPEGLKRLNALFNKQQITNEELTTGANNLSTYRDLTFDYTRQYYRNCQPPLRSAFLEDSIYAERLRYMADRLKKLISNPDADFNAITPEVTDYVPAKKGCKGKPEDILTCTQKNITKRISAIYKSIAEDNPHNQEPYKACADLGQRIALTYASLVGIIHHKKAPLRAQEVADIQDKMVGLTQQDLTEGY